MSTPYDPNGFVQEGEIELPDLMQDSSCAVQQIRGTRFLNFKNWTPGNTSRDARHKAPPPFFFAFKKIKSLFTNSILNPRHFALLLLLPRYGRKYKQFYNQFQAKIVAKKKKKMITRLHNILNYLSSTSISNTINNNFYKSFCSLICFEFFLL